LAISILLACSGPALPLAGERDGSATDAADGENMDGGIVETFVLSGREDCPSHEYSCDMSLCLLFEPLDEQPARFMEAELDGRPLQTHRCADDSARGFAVVLPGPAEPSTVVVNVNRREDVCWRGRFEIEGYVGYETILNPGNAMEACR
jgi:hypothetical protein